MIDNDIQNMYRRWIEKSEQYNDINNLTHSFDKFFTLFVAYNILYAETGKILVSRNEAKLNKFGGINDSDGATKYVVKYLDKNYLLTELRTNTEISKSIAELNAVIPSKFYIKDSEWDKKVLAGINSNQSDRFAKNLLELIYGVRCNMFHGSKEFITIQKEILNPCNVILKRINELLFSKLIS